MQRPRKVGAKFTGDQIAPDEHAQPNLNFDYDGKRDRWNGFNPEEYEAVWDEYAKIEEVKLVVCVIFYFLFFLWSKKSWKVL